MCENFYRFRNPTQTLHQSVDVLCVMDTLRQQVALPLAQLGILAALFLEYLSTVESHHDTCHKNELYRSRKTPRQSNSTYICIQGNPFHVLGTSKRNETTKHHQNVEIVKMKRLITCALATSLQPPHTSSSGLKFSPISTSQRASPP